MRCRVATKVLRPRLRPKEKYIEWCKVWLLFGRLYALFLALAFLVFCHCVATRSYGTGTNVIDLATSGSVPDQTVTITRNTTDAMVLLAADVIWENNATGTSQSLGLSAGVTDHGALTGIADDDHTTYPTWVRFADRLGINAGVGAAAALEYSTTGSGAGTMRVEKFKFEYHLE